jgi:hypothetical protein
MTYVSYNSPYQVGGLDLNTVNGNKSTVFPLNIYEGSVFPLSQYVCESGPRDTRYDYLYQSERISHPDAPSRFGYSQCWNGYCTGAWPGRYNTPPGCIEATDSQPKEMAPERFYHGRFQSPWYAESNASLEGRAARGNIGARS